jgi:hypothetical protein
MKITAIILSFAFLTVIGSSSDSYAGYSRRAQMSGYDATYHSTGRCKAGHCATKGHMAPHMKKMPKTM